MGRIIGICSAKGGVGKTTVAINLALALAKFFKKRVLLVDFNLTAPHLSAYLGITPRRTINEVLRGDAPIDECLETYFFNIKLLLASEKLEDLIGVELDKLKPELEKLKGNFDFVILDLAPGIGREAANGIIASDELIIVSTPDLPTFLDVLRVKEVAKTLGKKINGVVLNKVFNKAFEIKEKDFSFVKINVLVRIPFNLIFIESANMKVPVLLHKKLPKEIKKAFIDLGSYFSGTKIEIKKSFWEWLRKILRI
ncbi:MAG: AAA family ATPase [Candidatus Aenigmarchaeota archaeon]|nr:AAA family ATPase [Candidatus Aenigmarchaeota archaeon]